MKKVVTLGEILLRLSPPERKRIIGNQSFDINYGGSEGNVAVALSSFGIETMVVSKMPKNTVADAAIHQLNQFGVNTEHIIRGGERVGIYFLENGFSIRPSQVTYDRKNSSISEARLAEFDLDEIFKGKDLFHVSGITLGISEEGFQLAKGFIEAAVKRGIKISFDFNYRSKLWTVEEAKNKFQQILPYVDIAFAGYLDFTTFMDFDDSPAKRKTDNKELALYEMVHEKYNFDFIISSKRTVKSASKNGYQGVVFDGSTLHKSKEYSLDIVDRVGTGDAFTAGFLYSYLLRKDHHYKVEFATAASALKHTISGDILIASVEEVENLFNDGTFHVQR